MDSNGILEMKDSGQMKNAEMRMMSLEFDNIVNQHYKC